MYKRQVHCCVAFFRHSPHPPCRATQERELTPLEFYESELTRLNSELRVAAIELQDFVTAQRLKVEVRRALTLTPFDKELYTDCCLKYSPRDE